MSRKMKISNELLKSVQKYISENYSDESLVAASFASVAFEKEVADVPCSDAFDIFENIESFVELSKADSRRKAEAPPQLYSKRAVKEKASALPDKDSFFVRAAKGNIEKPEAASLARERVAEELAPKRKVAFDEIWKDKQETFSDYLLALIDASGLSDPQVYKAASIDRKLFSKIRSDRNYQPSKLTAIAFAIALKLDVFTCLDLLSRAGYTLSRSSKFDLIIKYCIENKIYDLFVINDMLYSCDQILIGVM